MADFVIIGGGVYGCAVAWELASKGAEVCLLEARTIASGASGGLGSRGVRASGRDVRELPLMEEAYDIWPTLHEQLDGPVEYKRLGHFLLIEQELDLVKLQPQLWLQDQNGIDSRLLNGDEVREFEPCLSENIRAAIYSPNDGIANHTLTTQSYANEAAKLGADIREGTAVQSLEISNSTITAVMTAASDRIPVEKKVLLASNAHIQTFLPEQIGVTLPVWKMQPQVMHTEPVEP
ncbi:MAG: FAD-dependent oxidoreductase, partial [Chloroflexota bacterium]